MKVHDWHKILQKWEKKDQFILRRRVWNIWGGWISTFSSIYFECFPALTWMNNALIDSRIPVLFAALRRWDLAFGRTYGEVRGGSSGGRGCWRRLRKCSPWNRISTKPWTKTKISLAWGTGRARKRIILCGIQGTENRFRNELAPQGQNQTLYSKRAPSVR
jgi:hypothetical protein